MERVGVRCRKEEAAARRAGVHARLKAQSLTAPGRNGRSHPAHGIFALICGDRAGARYSMLARRGVGRSSDLRRMLGPVEGRVNDQNPG